MASLIRYAILNLGSLKSQQGDLDAAVTLFSRAVALDQQLNVLRGRRGGEASPQALFKLATALHRRRASRDDLERAEQLYEPLMATDGL